MLLSFDVPTTHATSQYCTAPPEPSVSGLRAPAAASATAPGPETADRAEALDHIIHMRTLPPSHEWKATHAWFV